MSVGPTRSTRPRAARAKGRDSGLRVCVVTGTRAEYGLLRTTMRAIASHQKLRLQTVVTGTHLLRAFGATAREIERDGFRIDARVRMQRGDDGSLDQAEGLSRGITGVARFIEQHKTDVVLVLGDRIEAMAGALAAVTTGKLLAHVHGGDVAQGDLDEGLRHAITKLAHLHFAATKDAARRIVRMGEEQRRVHVVGAPGLDEIAPLLSGRTQQANGAVRSKARKAIILHHPDGNGARAAEREMATVLEAARQEQLEATIILPNSDRGHSGIARAIERHAGRAGARVVASMPRERFVKELLRADVLIGNSSCGIIEAPFLGTPSVNIGDRQKGRLRGGSTVIDTAATKSDVCAAIERALSKRPIRRGVGPYGTGGAGTKIADILSSISDREGFRRKLCTY